MDRRNNIDAFSCVGLDSLIVAAPDSKVLIARPIPSRSSGGSPDCSYASVSHQMVFFLLVSLAYESHRFGFNKSAKSKSGTAVKL
jgi:hypothetical protein